MIGDFILAAWCLRYPITALVGLAALAFGLERWMEH